MAIDQKAGLSAAIADSRQAIHLNPGDLQFMYGTVADLPAPASTARMRRLHGLIAEEAMEARPQEHQTAGDARGDLLGCQGYPKSVRFLRVAIDADPKNPDLAQLILDSLLNQSPPVIS